MPLFSVSSRARIADVQGTIRLSDASGHRCFGCGLSSGLSAVLIAFHYCGLWFLALLVCRECVVKSFPSPLADAEKRE